MPTAIITFGRPSRNEFPAHNQEVLCVWWWGADRAVFKTVTPPGMGRVLPEHWIIPQNDWAVYEHPEYWMELPGKKELDGS